jgi:hypothetical protein
MASPDTNGTPTPANSQIIKNIGLDQSPAMTMAGQAPAAAPDLFQQDVSNAQNDVQNAYQPLLDNLTKQRADAIQRTAQNAADIKNIFGTLSTIRQQDAMKIADQFKASLLGQQQALAGRTAEARTGLAANQQGVAMAAGELGGGPQGVPSDSLTSQAVNQGIAGANQYQTVWEGLQGAMQGQTQQNLQNAISGYGYQQAATVQDLQRNLNTSLQQIDAQKAQVDSSIGQAKIQAKQNLASMQAEAAMKQAELQNAQSVAGITAKGRTDAATIAANAKLKAAATNAANRTATTSTPTTAKAKTFTEWDKAVAAETGGKTSGQEISGLVGQAIAEINAVRKKKATTDLTYKPTAATKQDIIHYIGKYYKGFTFPTYVVDYLNKYY